MATNLEDKPALVQLAAYTFNHELSVVQTLLEANGIVCYIADSNTVAVDPFLSNAIGGVKLFVEKKDAATAREIVKTAEAEYLAEVTCTTCRQPGLRAEEKINQPISFGKMLWNKLLFGQSATYSKKYVCNHCGSQFSEVPVNL